MLKSTGSQGEHSTIDNPTSTTVDQKPPLLINSILIQTSRNVRPVVFALSVITTTALAAIAVLCWLIVHVQTRLSGDYVAAEAIGGQFSATWAKLIDVGSSIVVAPLVLAITNCYIFKLVRLCAVNENPLNKRPVPLKAMIEVSSTDWGSFSLPKHWRLLRTLDPRLVCVSTIAILSAASFAFLTNVIAYELSTFQITNSTRTLEFLYSPGLDDWQSSHGSGWKDFYQIIPNLTLEEDSKFSADIYGSLSRLRLENIETLLPQGSFERLNASSASLNALAVHEQAVFGVSAYRLGMKCQVSTIHGVGVDHRVDSGGPEAVTFNISASPTQSPSEIHTFWADVENMRTVLIGSVPTVIQNEYPLIAFSEASSKMWFGWFGPEGSIIQMGSQIGEFPGSTFDNSDFLNREPELASNENMRRLTFYGAICSVTKQIGSANLRKRLQGEQNSTGWETVSLDFSDTEPVEGRSTSMWRDLQHHDLFKGAAYSKTPGLAGGLLEDSETSLFAITQRFLFLEGEIRTRAYELLQPIVLGVNSTLTYEVRAEGDSQELYRITFVPWILLASVSTLFGACGLTIILAVDSLPLRSYRTGRTVDILRLMMDIGTALESQLFEDSLLWNDKELDEWAENIIFRFQQVSEADGRRGTGDRHQCSQPILKLQQTP